jgi:hypothetical protein
MIQDSMGLGLTYIYKGNFGVTDGCASIENDDHRDFLSVKQVIGEIPNQTYRRLQQDEIQEFDLYMTIEEDINNILNSEKGE